MRASVRCVKPLLGLGLSLSEGFLCFQWRNLRPLNSANAQNGRATEAQPQLACSMALSWLAKLVCFLGSAGMLTHSSAESAEVHYSSAGLIVRPRLRQSIRTVCEASFNPLHNRPPLKATLWATNPFTSAVLLPELPTPLTSAVLLPEQPTPLIVHPCARCVKPF